MKLYVARDENGELYLYFGKPVKVKEHGCWIDYNSETDEIPFGNPEEFSQVSWSDNEPTELELKIVEK